MGKFDGFLILSDIDGTFVSKNNEEIENGKAVKYFIENGGRFSFATGRMIEHIKEKEFTSLINAPACLYNGGMIYDYETDRVLYEGRVNFSMREFMEYSREFIGNAVSVNFFYKNGDYSSVLVPVAEADDFLENGSDIIDIPPIKVIVRFSDVLSADEFKARAKSKPEFGGSYVSKSWAIGVEFNGADSTKGDALDFIKGYLGNIHTAIGIGDYDNDMSLLLHADVAAAVGNGIEPLKKIADVITKPANEYPLRDLINMIDSDPERFKNFKKEKRV